MGLHPGISSGGFCRKDDNHERKRKGRSGTALGVMPAEDSALIRPVRDRSPFEILNLRRRRSSSDSSPWESLCATCGMTKKLEACGQSRAIVAEEAVRNAGRRRGNGGVHRPAKGADVQGEAFSRNSRSDEAAVGPFRTKKGRACRPAPLAIGSGWIRRSLQRRARSCLRQARR